MGIISPYHGAAAPLSARTRSISEAGPAPDGDRFVPAEPGAEPSGIGVKVAAGLMLGLTCLGLAGCGGTTTAPQPTDTSISTELSYVLMSTQDEIELGKQVSAQVEKEVPLWHDQAAQERVNRIGAQLARVTTRHDITYEFKLLDTNTVNAMAVPGGTIYVTRGAMQNFKDDRELTFILGHELGHLEQRHSVKQLGRDAIMQFVLRHTLGAGTADRIAETVLNNKMSQGNENQADHIGQQHLRDLGINPWYGVFAMQHLQTLVDTNQPHIITKIFSDHPPTIDRVNALERGAQGTPRP